MSKSSKIRQPGFGFANLLSGAVAGGLATTLMGLVSGVLYDREDPRARKQEDRARGNHSAYEIAAQRLGDLAGIDLTDEQETQVGTAIHYGIGIGSGAVYGAVRHQIPLPAVAKGLAFGASLWLLADEGLTPALGLTPGPRAFPWQTHARGLAAHLVFGLSAEGLLSAADLLRSRRSETNPVSTFPSRPTEQPIGVS